MNVQLEFLREVTAFLGPQYERTLTVEQSIFFTPLELLRLISLVVCMFRMIYYVLDDLDLPYPEL